MKNLIIASLLTFSFSAHAFDDADAHLDAHVHGLVEINLVAEASHVEIQITSPLMNLVGFEYAPRTEAERTAIHTVATHFETPHKWLKFNDNICQLRHHFVSHGDEYDAHHDHDKHENQHAELEAKYQFKCESDSLDSMTVSLQKLFPAIESITLIWVVNAASGLATLHHGDGTVYFKH
jgi:hypothetical protein